MSSYNIGWIWDQKVTAAQKLVLFALNEHTNMGHGDWRIWPSLRRICALTGLCERAVRDAIRDLTKLGIITVCAQRDASGRQLSNLYYLNAPFPGGEGAANAGGRGHLVPGEGAFNAPEPSNTNPVRETKNNGDEYAADFLTFWSSWPSGYGTKGSKVEAYTVWRKLKAKPPVPELLAALTAQADEKAYRQIRGEFAESFPHVCRWLKRRGWEDEVSLPAVSGEVYR